MAERVDKRQAVIDSVYYCLKRYRANKYLPGDPLRKLDCAMLADAYSTLMRIEEERGVEETA